MLWTSDAPFHAQHLHAATDGSVLLRWDYNWLQMAVNTLQRPPATHGKASQLKVTGGHHFACQACPASYCLACGCLQLVLRVAAQQQGRHGSDFKQTPSRGALPAIH